MERSEDLYGNIYEKDEIVFRQGDRGDTMYIIQSGAVEVSQSHNGQERVLSLLDKGDFFGEMALVDNQPRSATIKTICRSRLLALNRSTLLNRLRQDSGVVFGLLKTVSKRTEDTQLLLKKIVTGNETSTSFEEDVEYEKTSIEANELIAQKVTLDRLLNDSVQNLIQLSSSKALRQFHAGETIFNKNDSGNEMYIVVKGSVEISHTDLRTKYVMAKLGPSNYFGELGMISDSARTATAVALEETQVLVIKHKEFIEDLKREPELGLIILQFMIVRLRQTLFAINSPAYYAEEKVLSVPAVLTTGGKININFVSLSACSGCIAGLLHNEPSLQLLLEYADVSYSTMLIDQENIGFADVTIVDGAVRSREEEEKLRDVRNKSGILVAFGTCSAYGGIPVYANEHELEELISESYGEALDPFSYYLSGGNDIRSFSYQTGHLEMLRKAGKADDYIKVDYYLPGCPPPIELMVQLIGELSGKSDPKKIPAIVCAECTRKPFKCPDKYTSDFPAAGSSSSGCLNSQGILCLGFITRGGCKAVCPEGGLPCWCCRGPSNKTLKEMIKGKSLEKVLLDTLTKRYKLSPETLEPLINALCREGNSMLRFDNYFTHEQEKIR